MIRKNKFHIIIGVVALLICGLILIQFYWIRDAYQLKAKALDDKVDIVLDKVVANTVDLTYSFYMYGRSYIKPGDGVMMLQANYNGSPAIPDTIKLFNAFPRTRDITDTCFYSTNISLYDSYTMVNATLRFENLHIDSLPGIEEKNTGLKNISFDNFRERLNDALPITDRIKLDSLSKMLAVLLVNTGITNDFCFGLKRLDQEHYEYISESKVKDAIGYAQYKTMLFTDLAYTTPYQLSLYIADRDSIINKEVQFALLSSVIIILALTTAFIFFYSSTLRQKKLSEMKTDFINNMTHEFMTPVTTIGLAAERLEQKGRPDKEFLVKLIADENKRIRQNLDNILQIARLDKHLITLNPAPLDLHQLLYETAAIFEQRYAFKESPFRFHLEAVRHVVIADRFHIGNMFSNIIDNAIKYTGDATPEITLSSTINNNHLFIAISDNGIGIAANKLKHIFDSFYRVTHGNIHDVKGFGLGLSYVKGIAQAHDISINVTSAPNKGTTFTFAFKL